MSPRPSLSYLILSASPNQRQQRERGDPLLLSGETSVDKMRPEKEKNFVWLQKVESF